jgi:SSS family solute:Na+ symporter
MALTAGITPSGPNYAVPDLFIQQFPAWFTGVAFAAIAIGALVPAAVASIAAANLFTRNLWGEFVNPNMTEAEEPRVAKIVSLGVKVGALAFIILLPTKYAIRPSAIRCPARPSRRSARDGFHRPARTGPRV